jgi:hypothetical protein
MNTPTYLTVDLDYWAEESEFPFKFLNRIKNMKVPVAVAVHHHDLIDHMNKFRQCRRLVNIDTHADICGDCGPTALKLECGTWGNFIKWGKKKGSSFIWSYPDVMCVQGRTNETGMWCDIDGADNPFFRDDPREVCGWTKVMRRSRPFLTHDERHNLVAVGVCLSPDYLHIRDIPSWAQQFRKWGTYNHYHMCSPDKEWKRWEEF